MLHYIENAVLITFGFTSYDNIFKIQYDFWLQIISKILTVIDCKM